MARGGGWFTTINQALHPPAFAGRQPHTPTHTQQYGPPKEQVLPAVGVAPQRAPPQDGQVVLARGEVVCVFGLVWYVKGWVGGWGWVWVYVSWSVSQGVCVIGILREKKHT